jgi:hypothetical protein
MFTKDCNNNAKHNPYNYFGKIGEITGGYNLYDRI